MFFAKNHTPFDQWLESHKVETIDLGCIVDEMVSDLAGSN
jgi:hypothetical protein